MNKTITTIILLLFITFHCLSIYGQQNKKCKCTDEADEFTKKRQVSNEVQTIYNDFGKPFPDFGFSSEVLISVIYNNKNRFILWKLVENEGGVHHEFISLEVLLSNDSTVNFTNEYNHSSDYISGTHLYAKFYKVYERDWNLLKNNLVKKIRITLLNNSYSTLVIKEKQSYIISAMINCIDAYKLPIEENSSTDN